MARFVLEMRSWENLREDRDWEWRLDAGGSQLSGAFVGERAPTWMCDRTSCDRFEDVGTAAVVA